MFGDQRLGAELERAYKKIGKLEIDMDFSDGLNKA